MSVLIVLMKRNKRVSNNHFQYQNTTSNNVVHYELNSHTGLHTCMQNS